MTPRTYRLLIIEDVEDHALLLVRRLQKEGIDTSFERVETREELEDALEAGGWDAVISDYNLPGFNGRDALEMVQARGDVPFILVSGAIGEELAAELMRAGAHAYISKGKYDRLAPTLEREVAEAAIRAERRGAAEELTRYREELETLVHERTALLEKANEALRHSESRLKLALEAAEMCTWRFLPDSKERTWDEHCRAIFHLPPGEELTYQRYLSVVHPEDRETLEERIGEACEGVRPYNFEYRLVWPDGSVRWVMSRGEFSSGEPRVLTGVLLDITDRKKYEAEIERARQAAEEADLAKSAFLANMSHEIRTPLNGVLGVADLLFETDVTPLQSQYLQMIRNSAEVLLSVVNDVLDFSKIEAGKLELERVEFDLRETLEKVVEMLALHAHRKRLELSLAIDSELPDFFFGDPVRLRQVLTNLAGNAVKFTEQGEVVLRLRGAPLGGGERWLVTFSVTDTGIGIPQEKLVTLFESFSQVDPSMGRAKGGTGLGLAISRRLVEQMGGRIVVDSRLGEGTTFAVELELERSGRLRAPDPVATEIAGLRALVLDDNDTNREILVRWLSERGALVESAITGEEAIRKVTEGAEGGTPFDLAFLDYNLPGMDGFEVAEALRSRFSIGQLGIMMLTSDDVAAGARRARQMGMAAYIVKPVRSSALAEAVHKALSFSGDTALVKEQPQPDAPPPLPFCTRVLVAEDNMVNLTVAEAMLRRAGAKVTPAVNGAEAVQAVAGATFDVVLMDVQMPGIDGLQATRSIRESGSDVPIIGLTALSLQGDRERCLEAGMDDYLSKPFVSDALIDKVAHWSQRRPRVPANLETVRRQVGGSSEIVDCVVATFRENAAVQLAELRRAVEAMDAAGVERGAHRLKGAVMVIGAETARCLAEELEESGRENDLLRARPLQDQLEAEIERVLRSVDQGRSSCDTKGRAE